MVQHQISLVVQWTWHLIMIDCYNHCIKKFKFTYGARFISKLAFNPGQLKQPSSIFIHKNSTTVIISERSKIVSRYLTLKEFSYIILTVERCIYIYIYIHIYIYNYIYITDFYYKRLVPL